MRGPVETYDSVDEHLVHGDSWWLMVVYNIWLVVFSPTPQQKMMDWVRQLGTFPTEWKVIIRSCSKPPIRIYIYYIIYIYNIIYIHICILYNNIYRQATRVFSPIFGASFMVTISPGDPLQDTALLQHHDFIVWYGFWCRRLRSPRVRCETQWDMEKLKRGEKKWDTVWSRIHEIHEHVKIDIYIYKIAICQFIFCALKFLFCIPKIIINFCGWNPLG